MLKYQKATSRVHIHFRKGSVNNVCRISFFIRNKSSLWYIVPGDFVVHEELGI